PLVRWVGSLPLAVSDWHTNISLGHTSTQSIDRGLGPIEAAMRTGAQRLRPVMLTAITTVVGLMPMVLQWNIDILHQSFSIGAPSSQWWTQLSTAIAGSLTFATVLTLILTPCLLVLGE